MKDVDLRDAMEVVAGAVHPAETTKALLHLEATATKNYGHRGHHKAALVSHRAWVTGLGGLSSAETGNCIRSTNVRENRNPRKKTGCFSAGEVETVSSGEPGKGTLDVASHEASNLSSA